MNIYFEGVDGSGKTTLIKKIHEENQAITYIAPPLDEFMPTFLSPKDYSDWWFYNSDINEFITTILTAYLYREKEILSVSKSIVLVDKGLFTIHKRLIATLIFRGFEKAYAEELVAGIEYSMNIQNEKGLHIFLSRTKPVQYESTYEKYQSIYRSLVPEPPSSFVHIDCDQTINQSIFSFYSALLSNMDQFIGEVVKNRVIVGIGGYSESGKSTLGKMLNNGFGTFNLKIIYFVEQVCQQNKTNKADFFLCSDIICNILICKELNNFMKAHYYQNIFSVESMHSSLLSKMLSLLFHEQYIPIGIESILVNRINRQILANGESFEIIEKNIKLKDCEKNAHGQKNFMDTPYTFIVHNDHTKTSFQAHATSIVRGKMKYDRHYSFLNIDQLNIPDQYKSVILSFSNSMSTSVSPLALVLTGSCYYGNVIPGKSDIDFLIIVDVVTKELLSRINIIAKRHEIKIGFTVISKSELVLLQVDSKTMMNIWRISNFLLLPIIWHESLMIPRPHDFELRQQEFRLIPNSIHELRRKISENAPAYSIEKSLALLQRRALFVEKEADFQGYQQTCDNFSEIFGTPSYDISAAIETKINSPKYLAFTDYCLLCVKSLYQSLHYQPTPNRAGVILMSKGRVLLIYRKKSGKEYWTIPGGKIEEGESSFSAACREMSEELAISIETVHFVDSFDIINLGRRETYFLGELNIPVKVAIHGEELLRSSNENIYTPEWVNLVRLDDIVLYPPEAKDMIKHFNESL